MVNGSFGTAPIGHSAASIRWMERPVRALFYPAGELTVFLQRALAGAAHHHAGDSPIWDEWEQAMAAVDWLGLLLIAFLVMPLVTARPSRY